MKTPVRIGAIPSLNALPLTAPLEDTDPALATITWDAPSALADRLVAGTLDLALIPQVEMARDPALRFVPGLAIACRGAVESILLFHRRPWSTVERVAVDRASRSSVELMRVLFHHARGTFPEIVEAPEHFSPTDLGGSDFDAFLCIGDRALVARRTDVPRLDLGEEWFARTGLPFVFALWVGRPGVPARAIEWVRRAAAEGHARRVAIAHEFVARHPEVLSAEEATRYLVETLHHTCGPDELAALERFAVERRAIGRDLPEGWRPLPFSEETVGDGVRGGAE